MKINNILIFSIAILAAGELFAKKAYTTKPIYAGFGKVSKSTGKIKTKSTHGYFKKSNGYKFVNPYSRS